MLLMVLKIWQYCIFNNNYLVFSQPLVVILFKIENWIKNKDHNENN